MNKGRGQISYGESSLQAFVRNNCRYIDKTAQIYKMISKYRRVFLSRPRRFGKSLIVNILSEIFKGNKELFRGLAIYDKDYDWEKYAVIRIDMSRLSKHDPELFKIALVTEIRYIAKAYGVDLSILPDVNEPSLYMSCLLQELQNRGQLIVVLVDECEYPVIDNIDLTTEGIKVFLDILKSFYATLKSFDEAIQFLFLTGVTRIAYTSIFSGINNLKDISFNPEFSDITGYTQEELESYFDVEINEGAKASGVDRKAFIEKIKDWYDGYRFSSEDLSVYNPADINLFFQDRCEFYPHWIKTGTPTFMVKLLSKFSKFDLSEEFLLPRSVEFLGSVIDITKELEKEQLILLLYQSGYLTVSSADINKKRYYLGFPNREVRVSFNSYIAESVWGKGYEFFSSYTDVAEALIDEDIEGFKEGVKRVFSSLQKTPQKYHENAVELVLSLLFRMAGGCEVLEQHQSGEGYPDIVVIASKSIYIIELKMDAPCEVALNQIKEKKYADLYISSEKYKNYSILAVGLSFKSSSCSYEDCKTEWIRKI